MAIYEHSITQQATLVRQAVEAIEQAKDKLGTPEGDQLVAWAQANAGVASAMALGKIACEGVETFPNP